MKYAAKVHETVNVTEKKKNHFENKERHSKIAF